MKKLPSQPIDGAEPTSYVRELLDAGRAEGADGYDVQAGLARHAALVQMNAPLPDWAEGLTREALTTGTAASASTGAKLLPWLIAPVVTMGVVAAVMLTAPERTERTASDRAEETAAPSGVEQTAASDLEPAEPAPAVLPSGAAEDEGVVEGEAGELSPAEESAAIRVEREVLARRAQSRAHAGSDKSAPSTSAKPASASAKSIDALMQRARTQQASVGKVALAEETESESDSAAARGSERSSSEAAVAAPAPAPAPKPVVDDARLEREMGMLATAQRVLKTDPQRALRLARQGEQEFAGSMFTQERQQVLLLALIELGQLPEAKRLALPYLKRYPNGPFSDRLRKALATGRVEN
jgi:hypothetical protein